MKISEVIITNHKGKIIICHKNKRGNIKSDYINITSEFLDCITKFLVSDKGRIYLHTDKEGKHYSIDINKMSDEEYKQREKMRKLKGQKALLSMQSIIGSMMLKI